jgi:hypothetical protein
MRTIPGDGPVDKWTEPPHSEAAGNKGRPADDARKDEEACGADRFVGRLNLTHEERCRDLIGAFSRGF